MKRPEEILCKYFGCERIEDLSEAIEREQYRTYDVDKIVKAMTEYAIEMCERQREICTDEACTTWGHGCDYDVKVVDQSSILNSPLPEELC